MSTRAQALLICLAVLVATINVKILQASNVGCAEQASYYLPVFFGRQALNNTSTSLSSNEKSDGMASWGSTIAVSPTDGRVWTVNPDSGSVSLIDPQEKKKIAEITTGGEPWSLAVAPDGKYVYVTDRAGGQVSKISAESLTIEDSIVVGPELGAIALSPSGRWAYVTLTTHNQVAVIDTRSLQVTTTISVDRGPYAIGVTDDGDADDQDEQIIVTHFFGFHAPGGVEATDTGREGHVTLLNACTHETIQVVTFQPDTSGFANLLAGVSIHQQRAWIPLVRAAPDLPNSLITTVFAAVSALDLSQQSEDTTANLPLNDLDIFGSPINNPVAAVPSPNGNTLYVVAAGSDLIEVVNVAEPNSPTLMGFLAVGINPRGMALSVDGTEGYVMNYLSRSVSILDLLQMKPVAEVVVTDETLAPDVLRGKILFNNAVDPKLSRGAWISCASCHPNGGTDNVTWMFPDGPRQTPPIWNATQTLPWHWSAALDEPQDVEETIHIIQHGLGLAAGTDPDQLGTPNAGRSADLDALATFMAQDIRVPALSVASSPITETLSITESTIIEAGRQLFQSSGCNACHGGTHWAASALPGPPGSLDVDGNGMVDAVLHDVGTLNARDIRGVNGFDPPSLLNVKLTAPYLHDGSMPSLDALLKSGHPTPNSEGEKLDDESIEQLAQFLRTIDLNTPPFDD